jgi:glycosyltransferase involved in cell wall biosynthesis
VPFAAGHREPIVNRWPGARAERLTEWRQAMLARERAAFPETLYSLWRPRVEAVAYAVHRRSPVDLVIATGNPYVDFVVPLRLHAEFGVPFVLDDRDSWVVNVYTGVPHAGGEDAERWLGRMLGECLETWFVNPPIADWHRTHYPEHADRIAVVENGWDTAFLDPAALTRPVLDPLVFGFVGTINAGLPLELLVQGWRAARRRGLPESAEFRLYGQLGHVAAAREQELLLQGAAVDGVRLMGRWPKTRIAEAYEEIDVLVFAKEGGGMVTSGKVYEYVATGKPIAGVIDAHHDARRVLDGYPRAHLSAGTSVDEWTRSLLSAAADARSTDPAVRQGAVSFGERFRRDRILAPAVDRVLAMVAR